MPRQSETELKQQLDAAAQAVAVGKRYAHYKHPEQAYIVRGFVILEATDEVGVIYEAQYGEHISFVRTLNSWQDQVSVDGVLQSRFKRLD
jgi:hypothetical protein